MTNRRLMTVELIALVLPCTIFWALTAPWLVLIIIRVGPFGPGLWLPLWLAGGGFGLVALWSAAFNQASDPGTPIRPWQWAGLVAGLATSLSLLVPSWLGAPQMRWPKVVPVVVALPIVAAVRVVARYEGASREQSTG